MTRRGPRRRWLPRTGPKARWPARARVAGQSALLVTVLLLICGFLLVRYSPERFLRLVDVYRSLPVAVVAVVLVSGVIYFALDTVRLLIMQYADARDDGRVAEAGPSTASSGRSGTRPVTASGTSELLRRRLLLATLGFWLLLTVIAAVLLLWYPSSVLFGGTG
ncbi:hypothetical protein [Nakamurella lactea]|uniref:hypothetical protein n=1 Tax=Nakamurella lactea TaxID=459515 RepID=UPI00041F7A38|nr:hypothetical protein [Nakamurella lactea]